jgi:hypothetical protein
MSTPVYNDLLRHLHVVGTDTMGGIAKALGWPPVDVQAALGLSVFCDLVEVTGDRASLTDLGKHQAQEVAT